MTPHKIIVRLALVGIEKMHPSDRADVYDAVAIIMHSVHPEESAEAQRIADTIREAEAAQMKFSALLKAADEQNA